MILQNGDSGMSCHGGQQCPLNLKSRRILGMENPSLGVPSLASQIRLPNPLGGRPFVKVHAEGDKLRNAPGAFTHDGPDHLFVAESIPCNQGVLHMKGDGILAAGHAGDATLSPGRIGISP